jgi:CRP-like cAMP-binding protein
VARFHQRPTPTLLLHLGDRFGEATGSGTVLKVRLTHQALANMIVSTREAVSKVMNEFQREGLIEVRNRTISVTPQLLNMRPWRILVKSGHSSISG